MKKHLLFLIVILSLISCKKDDDSVNAIFNNWTYISGGDSFDGFEHLKYLTFERDYKVSFLYEYNYGIRSSYENLCQIINDSISMFRYYHFTYTVDKNVLILSNDDGEIIFEKKGDEPAPVDWVKPVHLIQSMDAPNQTISDLTFDGSYMWYGGFHTYNTPAVLYKIDPSSLSVVDELTVSTWPLGLEWADGYLWTSSNGYSSIYKIEPATGNTVFTSTAMGGWIGGIAYDSTYLWCSSNFSIYKYNPSLNTVPEILDTGGSLGGMAYIDGFLYVSVNGILNKCTVNPFEFVEAYKIDMGYIHGLIYDGTNFWISAYSQNEMPYYNISKISF